MNPKHLEINLQRLLVKSEELAENLEPANNWRLVKYVSTLEDYLFTLNKAIANKPSTDQLREYSKRIEFLKQLTVINKAKPNFESNKDDLMNGDVTSQFKLSNPGPIITNKDVKTKQIYHKTQLNKENLMREKLLGSGTAKAKTSDEPTESVDLTKLIAKQRENQEKLTEEMLRAVRGLKHNVGAVDQILKKDNQGLNKMNETAEKNSDNLKVVNDRLNERVSRTCNCWIWMMLMIILMVFIMMILFMKLFPKRRYGYDTSSSSYDSTYKHYIENKTIVIDNQTIHTMEL